MNKKDNNKNRLKGVSLFSSAGIAETYLKDVGIDIIIANELIQRIFQKFPKQKITNSCFLVGLYPIA